MRIARVRPLEFADEASRILSASWTLPSIHYSADYLRWQFSFPGPREAIGVAAFDGDKPVGFVGAVNRRLRLGDLSRDVYLSSFLAVLPEYRGAVAFGLMREFTEVCKASGSPVICFAVVGGLGEKITIASYAGEGFHHVPLNLCKAYGGVPRAAGADAPIVERSPNDDELCAVLEHGNGNGVLASAPTPEQSRHYSRDPRGGGMVMIRDTTGVPAGTALLVCSELLTKQGLQRMAAIDSIQMRSPSAGQLAAVVRAAAEMWRDRATGPLVVASNLAGIEPEIIKSAGLRELPSAPQFRGHLFVPNAADPFAGAKATNLEVV
jgi:hypothetical protein